MLSVGKLHSTMLTLSSLMLKPNKIRTFDSITWTPEHIHLTKWKTPASSKSATVRPGLRTCQSSYRPSRRSLPGCVRESRRERSKGKNGGFKNYYSPTDRQGYQWSRDKVNITSRDRNTEFMKIKIPEYSIPTHVEICHQRSTQSVGSCRILSNKAPRYIRQIGVKESKGKVKSHR